MSSTRPNRWFSVLYRTRIKVFKNQTAILNLSLAFLLLSVLCAPWLVALGFLIALALGYRFSIEKNAEAFSGDFDEVVREAARNIQHTADDP